MEIATLSTKAATMMASAADPLYDDSVQQLTGSNHKQDSCAPGMLINAPACEFDLSYAADAAPPTYAVPIIGTRTFHGDIRLPL